MNGATGQDEERRRLLANVDSNEVEEQPTGSPSPKRTEWSLFTSLAVVVLLILSGIVYFATHTSRPDTQKALLSNGTHEFKRTVILVSIDGLRCAQLLLSGSQQLIAPCRADYLDRGLTPHLLDISKQGIRAKYMTPIFPVRPFVFRSQQH